MLRVGLTGGIGSGKSTVLAQFAGRGAWVIDSDRIAREVVEPGSAGLRSVVEAFGAQILAESGALDRAALAARVFTDAAARRTLSAIVHPLVAARSSELLASAPRDAIVVQDIPLLVEAGLAANFPLVVVVHADLDVRVRRLVEQRGMPEPDVRARIAAQASDDQRRAAADVWLDNGGSLEATAAAIDRLWDVRLVPFEDNLRHHRSAPRVPPIPVLVAPDDSWPHQAQRVIARIAAVAGRRAHRIEHIGSTAVPGLAARDILDLQVVVADLAVAQQLAAELSSAGLVHREARRYDDGHRCDDGHWWDRAMATNADPARPVNCHIQAAASPTWRQAVLLRDWLRAHPEGVRQYTELKQRPVTQQWEGIEAYAEAKTAFIRGALGRAEQWAVRIGWTG